MILIDANLLLYAYDESSSGHVPARSWLDAVFSGKEQVWLSWMTILAFLRISTNPRALQNPLTMREASEIVETWLERPQVDILNPGESHWQILRELVLDSQVRSQYVADAHLAALAIEHGATLYTHDRDFARFHGLKFVHPI